MPKRLAAPALALATSFAAARSGHGFSSQHWHASDLFGPAVMPGCAAAVLLLRREK